MASSRKANRQGHTYKRGSSYRTVIKVNGRVISASGKSKEESRRLAKGRLGELGQNLGKLIPSTKISLSDYLLNWLENDHKHFLASTTYRRYLSIAVNHIQPTIGHLDLTEVTSREINNLLLSMQEKGQSPRSAQQTRAILSVCLNAAMNDNLIDSNPVRKVRIPQNRENLIHPLSIEEVMRLLATYMGTYMSARLHIAVICGMRQGEALGLKWSDIDLERRFIRVNQQIQKVSGKYVFTELKTSRSRRLVPLTEETINVLRLHEEITGRQKINRNPDWSEVDLVFPKPDGSPRSPMSDYDEWKKALKLCGIAPRRLHDARHTAATLMYSQGVGIETISRALGHSSSSITSRLYVHSAEEPLKEAATIMNRLLTK